MRVFLAVPATGQFIGRLTTVLDPLRRSLPLKWVAPVNWHLTIQFLGDWPESRVAGLKDALGDGFRGDRFDLRPAGLGVFPDWRRARVLFLQLERDGQLDALAADVRATVADIWPDGPQDTRPLQPHLTLARLKSPLDEGGVKRLQEYELGDLPQVSVEGVSLLASRLTPRGPVYTELGFFGLGPG